MTLRAIVPPPSNRRNSVRAWTLGFALALGLLLVAGPAGPPSAFATVLSVEPSPSQPTACDSVAVIVKGYLPDPCYDIPRVELDGPVLLPTMGPLPTYALRVRITARMPNNAIMFPCPTVIQPYERKLFLPFHPFGVYHATAIEYVVPFGSDSTVDSSRVDSTFSVAPDSTCHASCYLLDFRHPLSTIGLCDAGGVPGDTACVEIALGNRDPVAGIQSVIRVHDPNSDPGVLVPGDLLHPIRARAIGRADGFKVAWAADGSTIKFMLYSDTGAAIPAGIGPVLRVCYAIGENAPTGSYKLRFGQTVVADPAGAEMPPCPTLVEPVGRFCVGEPPCDLDGNGRSNVLDIVRLVRCALAGRDSTVCPDSIAARADCNGDGSIDIRDVICCVRKMLAFGFGRMDTPSIATLVTAQVGFHGPVEWISATRGRVELDVDPESDFGGVALGIRPAPGTTITQILVPTGIGYHAGFDTSDPSMARAMLVRIGDAPLSGRIPLQVEFEAVSGATQPGGTIDLVRAEGGSWSGQPASAAITSASVTVPGSPAPRVFPARPNPFTDATDIAYEVPSQRHVTLRIYSASGKLVRTLVDATVTQGVHRAPWNGRDQAGRVVGSGIYFVKLSAGEGESTIRIMRLK